MSSDCRRKFILPAFVFVLFCFLTASHGFSNEIRGKPIVRKSNLAKPDIATTTSAVSTPASSTKSGDYIDVSFDLLANFTFEVPDGIERSNVEKPKSGEQIPAEVRAFNQKKVALKGFMLPLKVDEGVVTEMLIMKDQSMCCYGAVPRINDWVSVKMKKGGVKSVMDQAVTLYGKLKVGEMLENGYLVGIYEMEGDKMVE